uniref:G_PROTEIN_RECEP_F1_2 domain-containing protein n=1 Tax=Meloidogyne hapla TaxID=6305 RepID=A0A1I8B3S2_MELHA
MLPELYFIIICCFGGIGLFFNFLLIWLIIRYTMIEMKVYSRILLQTCFVDIIGIIVFVIVQPVLVSDNGIGTVWEYGPTHYLPNPWQCLFSILFAFMKRFTTENVCSQFIFRYLTVVR